MTWYNCYYYFSVRHLKGKFSNSSIRHGKPVIEGTRITVEEVLGMLESGMTYKEIEEEYGLTKEEILAAIRYVISLIREVK